MPAPCGSPHLYLPDVTVCDLIDHQSKRRPHQVAVIDRERYVTYGELVAAVDDRARWLVDGGVCAGDRIGVGLERSLDMVLWVLALLKAGAAYVPLDPAYPLERLRFVVDDAGVQTVLTGASSPAWTAGLPVAILSGYNGAAAGKQAIPPRFVNRAGTGDIAYVIYTSGSTGTPKGVVVDHAALAHFVQIVPTALGIRDDDVWMLTASISYALQVRQLMTPLVVGATIVIATEEEMRDPQALLESVKAHGVTLIDFVPSYWRTCNRVLSQMPVAARTQLLDNQLRQIVSVGEPLTCDLAYTWRHRFGHSAGIVNILGQTETTGMFTAYTIPADVKIEDGVVPVGRAIPNVEIHLLDPEGKPVADGICGELYVSTPSLARGYRNRPDLTAQRFLPHPAAAVTGARLYRTGDLARRRPDGNLEHHGRVDQQVKIRGKRVDLIEVEAHLRHAPRILDAAVITRQNGDATTELVAYVTTPPGAEPSHQALWASLQPHLPEYALPAHIYRVDALPALPNGKLDRIALAAASLSATLLPLTAGQADVMMTPNGNDGIAAPTLESPCPSKGGDGTVQPSTSVADDTANALYPLLHTAWTELLETAPVSIHDDFFALGGHSLQAALLASRLGLALGRRVPVELVFQAPTIERLAAALVAPSDANFAAMAETLVPLRSGGSLPPLFLVHGLGGGVVGYADLVRLLPPDRPVYGLIAAGLDVDATPDATIETMAARYLVAVRSVQPAGPYHLGGYCYGGVVAFEMARQLAAAGEPPALVAILEGFAPGLRGRRSPLLHPERLRLIARNLPFWWEEYRQLGMPALRRRVTRKLPHGKLRMHVEGQVTAIQAQALVDDDLSVLPDYRQQLMEAHVQAIRSYRPDPYPGQVIVFRARGRTVTQVVSGPLDEDLGWGRLAAAGAVVYAVDGAHRNLHMLPYVPSLAAKLGACLARADWR